MKINFTKKQYKHLLDLLYLGNWTANSSRMPADIDEDYEELLQYIYTFAKAFGYDDNIIYDKKLDKYFPTLEFEEGLQPLIEENDNDVFWNELSSRLAKRDLGRKSEKFTNTDDYMKRLFESEEKYEIEFDKNGIENLEIRKDKS